MIVLLGLVARGSPGGDHEVRGQGLAIAHRVDPDLPLLARTRTGDRLPHEQRADEVIGIGDVHRLGLPEGIVASCPAPITTTSVPTTLPSDVSVTVHSDPAGMGS